MRLFEYYEDWLEELASGKKFIIFGAGERGVKFIKERISCDDANEFYEKLEYICDNDAKKWGKKIIGKKICSPDRLLQDKDDVVVIIASTYYTAIWKQLRDMGIRHFCSSNFIKHEVNSMSIMNVKNINNNREQIEKVRSFFDEQSLKLYDEYIRRRKYGYKNYSDLIDGFPQYFPPDLMSFSENEIFLDVGSYDGKSSVQFAQILNGAFEKIYSFEANEFNFASCINTLSKSRDIDGRYEFIPMGASNKNGKSKMNPSGSSSTLDKDGSLEVNLCRIDDKIEGRVSLIKMDIEGFELEALEGAQSTIKKYKPKLAISIYHKIEDLWQIPLYIKQIVPEYRFYVRHYYPNLADFVLYAVVEV